MKPGSFGALLQAYFLQRLIRDRNASPATVSAYRDTFRLFLRFARTRLKSLSTPLTMSDFTAPMVLAFLEHLEKDRGNGIRTRNARLAALRAFTHYASSEDPTALPALQRILAIPLKHHARPVLGYLTKEEVQRILDVPDPATETGRRDRILFSLLYNTGARISEALGLAVGDLSLDRTPHVKLSRQGPQGTDRSPVARHGQRTPGMASPPGQRGRCSALRRPRRRTPRTLGGRASIGARGTCRSHEVSLVAGAADLAPHVQAHDGDAPPRVGNRPRDHCVVAGSREPQHHARLPRGEPAHEAAGLGRRTSAESAPSALRSDLRAARLPGGTVIMRTSRSSNPEPTRRRKPTPPKPHVAVCVPEHGGLHRAISA